LTEETLSLWLPDWRDRSQYPDPKSASREQWAWEFLRRNKEYQEQWRNLSTSRPLSSSAISGGAFFIGDVTWNDFADRWGIIGVPPNPANNLPKSTFFRSSLMITTSHFCEDLKEQQKLAPRSQTEIVVRLPLTQSLNALRVGLEPILKSAIESCKNKLDGESKAIARTDNYAAYLRIFDGFLSGASRREIALELYPRQDLNSKADSVSYDLDRAKELVDSGYLRIANLANLEQEITD